MFADLNGQRGCIKYLTSAGRVSFHERQPESLFYGAFLAVDFAGGSVTANNVPRTREIAANVARA